jgi:hypothetical protein
VINSRKLLAAVGVSVMCAAIASSLYVARAATRGTDRLITERQQTRCPHRPVPPQYGKLDEAVAAARRLLIRGYVSAQGQTILLTPKNSPILEVMTLARTAIPLPGAATLRSKAARQCGMETAEASWAVMIGRPAAMPRESIRLVFLLKTKEGWRIY